MSKPLSANLSNEEMQEILQKFLVAEVLKLKNPAEKASQPWWKDFLQSGSGAALITVILGGFIGGILTARFQQQTKKLEILLLSKQKLLENRDAVTKQTFSSIGSASASADMLIKSFNSVDATEAKQDNLKGKFDEAAYKWNSEKNTTILSLSYYYENNDEVKKLWNEVDDSMIKYFECAEKCNLAPDTECQRCAEFKNNSDAKVNNLEETLVKLSIKSLEEQ